MKQRFETVAGVWLEVEEPWLSVGREDAAWRAISPAVRLSEDSPGEALELGLTNVDGDREQGYELLFVGRDAVGEIRLRVGLSAAEPVALLRLDWTPATSANLWALSLAGGLEGGFDRVWKQGWQSWSPAFVRPLGTHEGEEPEQPGGFGAGPTEAWSYDAAQFAGPGISLSAGLLTADRFLGRLAVSDEVLSIELLAGGVEVEAGQPQVGEVLRLDFELEAASALDRHAVAVAANANAEVPRISPSGWCSWYYYYSAVGEADVLANIEFLAKHKRALPLQYVQLDDGYQADIGDWSEWNEKFPHGPRWLADRIHDAGFKAGLWLAPFIAGRNSRLVNDHPEWLARDPAGNPVNAVTNWGQKNYVLDLTHPEVQGWLDELFQRVVEEWGFDYVKLDFIFGGAMVGQRLDPKVTALEAYREGLAIIRRAVGERFVLGCGALQLASVGLVDGMRIGPDVAPWYRARGERLADGSFAELPPINGAPSAEAAIRNTLNRQWMHGRYWLNDPDCVLVREERTKLTSAEIESLATVVGLSGGMTLLSDNMPALGESALKRLSFILPPLPAAGQVPTLLNSDMPDRIELDAGERAVVALFNWSDGSQDVTLRVSSAEVFDVWDKTYLGRYEGTVRIPEVPAHGCRLLALSPADGRPRVLGSSFHIGQGLYELATEAYEPPTRTLVLAVNPMPIRSGSLWVRWPFEGLVVEGEHEGFHLEAGVARIDLTVDRAVELLLRPPA
ncbi:MAG: alpha-galactosidase [Dehalococcoidia bacterium]